MWKPIEGYLYSISEAGEVRNDITGLIRKRCVDGQGYLHIDLYNNEGCKWFLVHRLVAQYFIDNPLNLPVVNHLDENKQNPHKDNLEWTTYQENSEYSLAVTHTFLSPAGDVVEITNIHKFCKDNNLSRGHMYNILNGVRKSHKGWRCIGG